MKHSPRSTSSSPLSAAAASAPSSSSSSIPSISTSESPASSCSSVSMASGSAGGGGPALRPSSIVVPCCEVFRAAWALDRRFAGGASSGGGRRVRLWLLRRLCGRRAGGEERSLRDRVLALVLVWPQWRLGLVLCTGGETGEAGAAVAVLGRCWWWCWCWHWRWFWPWLWGSCWRGGRRSALVSLA